MVSELRTKQTKPKKNPYQHCQQQTKQHLKVKSKKKNTNGKHAVPHVKPHAVLATKKNNFFS
jgi:hypothetical protein